MKRTQSILAAASNIAAGIVLAGPLTPAGGMGPNWSGIATWDNFIR